MSDDSGHLGFGRRRQRRAGHDSDMADNGTSDNGTDASGWLAAQFQDAGDTPAEEAGPGFSPPDTGSLRSVERSAEATPDVVAPPAAAADGFRWGLKPQTTPAAPPPASPVPSNPGASNPAASNPVASNPPPLPQPAAVPADPFWPADPHLPVVPPDLPVAAAPVSRSAPAESSAATVQPPDRALPTELFSPVQPGEPTEPLASRRTFRPRVLPDPDTPGPVPPLATPPAPPLIPATVHRENEDSPLAALFREREHQVPAAEPTVRLPSVPAATPPVAGPAPRRAPAEPRRPPGSGWSGNRKLLLWGGGAVLALLALIGLFFLGTRLPELFGSAPATASETTALKTASPSASPSLAPSPTPSASLVTQLAAVGPLTPGTHPWESLRGGECLGGYESPWAEEFAVVDCAVPHPAQMVHHGVFGPDDAGTYPGVDALQAQINLLCSAPTVIDFAAAGAYNDIQFAASYAATEAEWIAGHRDYFCFISRSSGEPLTGSVAVSVG
ncbi:hypothetical protein GCM10027052_23260 [Parafrigoribacterium mesophilum]|uniref:hypothetical protein n=1 Tax=Parafrigoribacterium mesophilum TaxID=433646 RepID=UPI0031FC0F4F